MVVPARIPRTKTLAKNEVRQLFQATAPNALATLIEIMQNPQQPAQWRIKAAEVLLERGYGKVVQEISMEEGRPVGLLVLPAIGESRTREVDTECITISDTE